MSRLAKWKLEKSRVKVVFRLQFHATHIPQSGWDKLFISLIPSETGKATAKTTKANVRNGSCKWADPIYETTRLLQDTKTKHYDEKLYKIVVALGSSRASILGEATLNLADYADALKPSAISLPLNGNNSATILHVTVQLLSSKTGFREFEQQREQREKGLESKNDEGVHGKDIANDQLEKVNTRVRFRDAKEVNSLEEEHGYDDSSNTSESLYFEKHDSDSLKSTVSGDLNGLKIIEKGDTSDDRIISQGTNESAHGWASDYSVDNDLSMVYEENHKLKTSLELAESSIFELKQEITSLQSQTNDLGIETQKVSNFLASEISSSEEIVKEVSLMRSECLKFKEEIENLKLINKNPQIINRTDHDHRLLEEKKLKWIDGILSVENRIKELQNKTFLGFNERDFRSFDSELENFLKILHDIKRGASENVSSIGELDLDLSLPESLLQNLNIPPLISRENDSSGVIDAMKSKIFDLTRELNEVKTEKESFARKMDHMECYYEALIQELEENHKQVLGELQNLRNEHSICLYTITSNKAEMESVCEEMNQKMLRLVEENLGLDSLNKELDKRANISEAALRRARLNYTIAVDKLQKDLELLSSQVVSMFETNENLMKQAFSEDFEGVDLLQSQKVYASVVKYQNDGDILMEDLKKSLNVQEELYRKVEEEVHEMQFVNLYLDIFSITLQETLLEADSDIGYIKDKSYELVKHLELSNEAQDQLIMRLRKSMEEIQILNEYKASCISKFNEMDQQNRNLEADFEAIKSEKTSYKMKYEACYVEKIELSNLLKRENMEKVELRNEISILNEELKMASAKIDELALLKENLDFVHEKLTSMSISYDEKFKGLNVNSRDIEFNGFEGVILKFEEMQDIACKKIYELMEENKKVNGERVLSERSLRLEIISLKEKFKSDIQKMGVKLDISNALIEKLQLNLENVVKKVQLSSEIEEKHVEKSEEFLIDLSVFENELQKLTFISEMDLEALAHEFGSSKSTITELTESLADKIEESMKLKSELERESMAKEKLEGMVKDLTSELKIMQEKLVEYDEQKDELMRFRQVSRDLENEKSNLLLHRNESLEKLQNESSRVINLQNQLNECLEKLRNESSCVITLQNQLNECLEKLQDKSSCVINLQTQFDECSQKLRNESSCVINLQTQLDESLEKLQNKSIRVLNLQTQLDDCLEKLQNKSSCVINLENQLDECTKKLQNESTRVIHMETQLQTESTRVVLLQTQLDECLQKLKNESTRVINIETQLNECSQKLQNESTRVINMETQLQTESTRVIHLQTQLDECTQKLKNESSRVIHIETQLNESLEKLQKESSHVNNLETQLIKCSQKLQNESAYVNHIQPQLDECLKKLHKESSNVINLETQLHECLKKLHNESSCVNLLQNQLLEMDEYILASDIKFTVLLNQNNEFLQHINLSNISFEDLQKRNHELEKTLNHEACYKEEIDDLILLNEELEITKMVLKDKFTEHNKEMKLIQSRFNELTRKLSEQVLKTEEFKNLSIHLKELSDKKEPESPPIVQESLRMAFIKEQYETKVQELKQQLLMSRKHGEELLLKLQDSLNEIEIRKKSEASYMRINEEISYKLVEMENDLQLAISDKCEKMNAYDTLKAEFDCTLLTLECCKEEKEKIESFVREYKEEKNKIEVELTKTKSQLENFASSLKIQKEENGLNNALNVQEVENKDFSVVNRGDLEENDGSRAHFNTMNLRSSMEHLHEELERMKNENYLLPNDQQVDPDLQVLKEELLRLHHANNQLRNMFPSFDNISSDGNALERVLALEIELAESLTSNNTPNIQFQSSFLKQHSDEEAILKSIKDINELIKEMLDLKGKYASLENELKEMHDRYSQLSLQYAEVEGERQKLKMTLKNVRGSRKLNRSTSDTITDQSP